MSGGAINDPGPTPRGPLPTAMPLVAMTDARTDDDSDEDNGTDEVVECEAPAWSMATRGRPPCTPVDRLVCPDNDVRMLLPVATAPAPAAVAVAENDDEGDACSSLVEDMPCLSGVCTFVEEAEAEAPVPAAAAPSMARWEGDGGIDCLRLAKLPEEEGDEGSEGRRGFVEPMECGLLLFEGEGGARDERLLPVAPAATAAWEEVDGMLFLAFEADAMSRDEGVLVVDVERGGGAPLPVEKE